MKKLLKLFSEEERRKAALAVLAALAALAALVALAASAAAITFLRQTKLFFLLSGKNPERKESLSFAFKLKIFSTFI